MKPHLLLGIVMLAVSFLCANLVAGSSIALWYVAVSFVSGFLAMACLIMAFSSMLGD